MAITVTLDTANYQKQGHKTVVSGSLAFDSSYPRDGEALTAANLSLGVLDELVLMPQNGYYFQWDKTNAKVKVFQGQSSGIIYASTTVVGNVGVGTDDLMAYTLPGGTLGTNLMGLRVTGWGKAANNVNAKTVTAVLGTTTLLTTALTVSQAGVWRAVIEILRTGAATQEACAHLLQGGTTTIVDAEQSEPAETLANNLAVKFTGAATADNDITQEGMIVELLIPPTTGTVGAEVPDTASLAGLTGVRFRAIGV